MHPPIDMLSPWSHLRYSGHSLCALIVFENRTPDGGYVNGIWDHAFFDFGHQASDRAEYSLSVIDRAISDWIFDAQAIRHPPYMIMYADLDFAVVESVVAILASQPP